MRKIKVTGGAHYKQLIEEISKLKKVLKNIIPGQYYTLSDISLMPDPLPFYEPHNAQTVIPAEQLRADITSRIERIRKHLKLLRNIRSLFFGCEPLDEPSASAFFPDVYSRALELYAEWPNAVVCAGLPVEKILLYSDPGCSPEVPKISYRKDVLPENIASLPLPKEGENEQLIDSYKWHKVQANIARHSGRDFEQFEERAGEVRDCLVILNLRYVASIVYSKVAKDGMETYADDFISVGVMGLLKAIERYIPNENKFLTYADYWIRHFIYRGKPQLFQTIRVPLASKRRFRRTEWGDELPLVETLPDKTDSKLEELKRAVKSIISSIENPLDRFIFEQKLAGQTLEDIASLAREKGLTEQKLSKERIRQRMFRYYNVIKDGLNGERHE